MNTHEYRNQSGKKKVESSHYLMNTHMHRNQKTINQLSLGPTHVDLMNQQL